MDRSVKAVFTLVHGTWSRSSRWTNPGSQLRRKLDELVVEPKLFLKFSWSGRNSPRARESAALALCAHLKSQIELHPDARQFVIGHSHGGNVALKALEIGNLFDKVSVACLSTPFFYIRPRFHKLNEGAKQVALGAVTAFMLLPSVLGLRVITDHWFTAIPCILLFLYLVWRIEKLGRDGAEKFRLQVAISIPQTASLMIIRTVGDEAAAAIAAFQIATWLMTKIGLLYISALGWLVETFTRFQQWLDDLQERFKWWMGGIAVLLFGLNELIAIVYKRHLFFEGIDRLNRYFLSSKPLVTVVTQLAALFPKGPLLGLILAAPVIFLALGILAGNALPIGLGALLGALVYEVTVEPVPPGTWELHQIEPSEAISGIMHSSTYESEPALAALSDWVNQRLAR